MTRAEEAALKAYPVQMTPLNYQDLIEQFEGKTEIDVNTYPRCLFQAGYEQAEKDLAMSYPLPEDTVLFQKGVKEGRRLEKDDLALTWKDMVLLRTLFDATDVKQSMEALTVQPMTREYYEYLLREFNEQRKK